MTYRVCKDFEYAADGINTVFLKKGDKAKINERHVKGLINQGLIAISLVPAEAVEVEVQEVKPSKAGRKTKAVKTVKKG